MRCIFCKEDSSASVSVEHIIPESLGNKSHILSKGIVCDKCNNYFASKIEKQVLGLPYFKNLRHRNFIFNKKNRLPNIEGFILHPDGGKIDLEVGSLKGMSFKVENNYFLELLIERKINKLYFPMILMPPLNDYFLSRLLGKIALEAFVERINMVDNWNTYLIEHDGLDDLRDYVRYGKGNFWDYNVRKIYEEDATFKEPTYSLETGEVNRVQTIHEYDFLYIENKYLYFTCAIMGIEYTISIGDKPLDIYIQWLKEHNNISPLSDEYQRRKHRPKP